MKKFLALAIAVVMTVALFAAGASAADVNHSVVEAAGGVGVWINSDSPNPVTVKFTTTGAFTGINFNNGQGGYWASCVGTGTGPEADWVVELYKFAYNTENTLAQAPAAKKEIHSIGDSNPAFDFTFDSQPAGTYIVKVYVTNLDHEEEVGGATKKPYVVLPAITNPDDTKFEFSGKAFNLVVIGEDKADFFAANPADTDAPAATTNASVVQPWFDNENTTGPDIQLRGWVIIDGDEIEDLGYRVDDKAPVFSSLQDRSAEVSGVMGSDPAKTNGFNVTFSTNDLSEGEHTVHVVVKTKGGEFLDVNKEGQDGFKVVGTGAAEQPTDPPATADAAVIAIAAVACVALAGVVIAKKVK